MYIVENGVALVTTKILYLNLGRKAVPIPEADIRWFKTAPYQLSVTIVSLPLERALSVIMALAHTSPFSSSLKLSNQLPPMATNTFSFSAKTLTLPYHSTKTPIMGFNSVSPNSIRTQVRTRNPIRIRAVLDEDYSSKRNSNSNEQRETIMLPGCDYNHWLIVMEFPKDPAPTREQMIDTYLQTLASVLGRFYSFFFTLLTFAYVFFFLVF